MDLDNCPVKFNCSSPNVSLEVGPTPSYISIVFSTLSCLGCILIITAYAAFKGLRRSVAQTVVTHIAIADLFDAIGVIIGGINFLVYNSRVESSLNCQTFSAVCIIQSYINQWTSTTAYIWTSVLAVNFMVLCIWPHKTHYIEKGIPYLVCFAWLFPLLFLLPFLCTGRLGYSRYGASNWCYVKSSDYKDSLEKRGVLATFIFANWIWQLLSIAIVVTAFTVTVIHVKCKKNTHTSDLLQHHKTVETAEKKLMLIPVFYVIIHVWDTVQIITSLILSTHVNKGCTTEQVRNIFLALGILQAIGDSGQGWVNAVLYIFASKLIRKKLFVQPFLKLVSKSRPSSKSKRNGNSSQTNAKDPTTDFHNASLSRNLSVNMNYPSETYFSIPYTDIGVRSDTIDPIRRF